MCTRGTVLLRSMMRTVMLLTRRCLFRGVHEGGEYGSLIGADLMGELGVPLGGPDETFAE